MLAAGLVALAYLASPAEAGAHGKWCVSHSIMGQVADVQLVVAGNQMSFRIDNDMHVPWCSGNRFVLSEDTSAVEFTASKCMTE